MIIWKYVTDPSKEGNENAYKVSTNLLQGQAAMQMLHAVTFTQNRPRVTVNRQNDFFLVLYLSLDLGLDMVCRGLGLSLVLVSLVSRLHHYC